MTEINPYEPPQTGLRSTFRKKSRAWTVGSGMERWIINGLLCLQFIVIVSFFTFAHLRDRYQWDNQRLQAFVEFSGISFLVLGLIMLLIASVLGYVKLAVFEIFMLAFFLWLTLPRIN